MIKEQEIEELMAEVFLSIIRNPKYDTNVETFCSEYHIDKNKLYSKKLFHMYNGTLFRLFMGIAQLANFTDYLIACIIFAKITYIVANSEDGTPEAILRSHEKSPMKRKS